jgi:hypothetical protein
MYSNWPVALRWMGWAWRPLGVLHLTDSELLLGSYARDELRGFSRHPRLDAARLQALVQIARQNGFERELHGVPIAPDADGTKGT